LLGNMSMEKQERELNDKPAIIIGTPGRLWAFLNEFVN